MPRLMTHYQNSGTLCLRDVKNLSSATNKRKMTKKIEMPFWSELKPLKYNEVVDGWHYLEPDVLESTLRYLLMDAIA